MNIRIIDYKVLTYSAKVVGEVSVQFFDVGIVVHGIKLIKSDNDRLIYAFPTQKKWDSEAGAWIEKDGKPMYFPIVSMPVKEDMSNFYHAMDEALQKWKETHSTTKTHVDFELKKEEPNYDDFDGCPF